MPTITMPPLTVADVKLEGHARDLADKTAHAGLIDCGLPLADVADDVLTTLGVAFPTLTADVRERIATAALTGADSEARLTPSQRHDRDCLIAKHDRSGR